MAADYRCPRCRVVTAIEVIFRRLKVANGGRPVRILRHAVCGEIFAVVLYSR